MNNEKRKVIIISVLIFVSGSLMMIYERYFKPPDVIWKEVDISDDVPERSKTIMVQISGAVSQPGIYTFNTPIRLLDALMSTGGALEQADLSLLNLTIQLKDQMHIVVPFQKTDLPSIDDRDSSSTIRLNTATVDELTRLKGIGPATAAKIIQYRSENGSFQSLEELQKVKGIGPKLFSRIQHDILL